MTSDEFPSYPCLEDETKFKEHFPKLLGQYVGSLPEEFVKSIVNVRCSSFRCNKLLINEGSPTMTGYCGHLFCSGCAQELCDKYNKERRKSKRGIKDDKGKYPPQEDRREVYYNSNDIGYPLYECKKCSQKYVRTRDGDRGFGYLKLFSVNSMVDNLYSALKKTEGFLCCIKGCGWHPKYNSLYCTLCNTDRRDNYRYVCLNHVDDHLAHDLIIMATSNPRFKARELPPDTRLSSVDRTELRVITSFYQCAFCGQQLEYDDDKKHARASHLECGHFVGASCEKDVLKKVDDPIQRRVHCFFCNDEVHLQIADQKYFMFPCTQLADLVLKAPHAVNDCKIGNCNKYHPNEQGSEGESCLCCTVEDKLKKRKKAVEEKERLPAALASSGVRD